MVDEAELRPRQVGGLLLKRLPRLVTAKIRPTTSTAASRPPTSQRADRGSRRGSSSFYVVVVVIRGIMVARAEAGKLPGARSSGLRPAPAVAGGPATPAGHIFLLGRVGRGRGLTGVIVS